MAHLSKNYLMNRFERDMYPASLIMTDETALWLQRTANGKQLAVLAPNAHRWLDQFKGDSQSFNDQHVLKLCPTDDANARARLKNVPNLKPASLGLAPSAGCGDWLGLATPGHIQAFRAVSRQSGAQPIAPIFMQQSIREMTRTNRTPADVMRDATWGAFEGGWRDRVGADADHLKTPDDIDACAAVGFSFYTIDPGAHVDSEADTALPDVIKMKVAALRWNDLESSSADLQTRYAGQVFEIEDHRITLNEETLWRAAAKSGNAIAHVTRMYRHLVSKGIPFELEVSVDETETPTTHAEHVSIASELKRLGVRWGSLAPRYVGRFEKGVDYIGDLKELETDLNVHAQIMRAFGPYKMSLHSGSDKFSVYPLIVKASRGVVHLKTAGTSYLEALRVIATADAKFFREIATLGYERYPTDRASYHVSAELSKVPSISTLPDSQVPPVVDPNAPGVVPGHRARFLKEKYGEQLKAV